MGSLRGALGALLGGGLAMGPGPTGRSQGCRRGCRRAGGLWGLPGGPSGAVGLAVTRYGRWQCRPDFMNGGGGGEGGGEADGCGEVVIEKGRGVWGKFAGWAPASTSVLPRR